MKSILLLALLLISYSCTPSFDQATYDARYQALVENETVARKMDTLNEAPAEIQLAYIVQTSLPLWNKNLSLLAQMEDMTGLPKEHLTPLKMWRQYIDLRMKAGQLKIQNLRHVPPIEWDRELEEYEVRYQQIQPF